MPTSKPRVSITLEPHQAEVLERVARAQGSSISALVRELVEAVEPGLRRVADLAEAAERASEEQRDALRRAVLRIDEEVAEPLLAALGVGGEAWARVDDAIRATTGNPPGSNQGGNSGRHLTAVGPEIPGITRKNNVRAGGTLAGPRTSPR